MSDASSMPTSGPVSATDIERELTDSDAIICGKVISVSDASGPVSLVSAQADPRLDKLREARVKVLRTLAGAAGIDLRVLFLEGNEPSRPWKTMTEGQMLLLFLRRSEERYVPVEAAGHSQQTLPDISSPPAGASRVEAVAHELEEIVLTADSVIDSNLLLQATTARTTLRCGLDFQRVTSLGSDPVKRTAWVAIGVAEGTAAALVEALEISRGPSAPQAEVWSLVVQKVSEFRSPGARRELAELVEHGMLPLARAAAAALRQLHDKDAITDLIRELDHSDQEVRYQAVMALAELAPDVHAGPSFNHYRRRESQYIELWKQWNRTRLSRES